MNGAKPWLWPRVPISFVQFASVGAFGFLIDGAVLQIFVSLAGVDPFRARAISYLAAATGTWWLNRRITFRGQTSKDPLREWARFLLVNGLGGTINYGLYAVLVIAWAPAQLAPVMAAFAGSAAGLLVNFQMSRRYAFSP